MLGTSDFNASATAGSPPRDLRPEASAHHPVTVGDVWATFEDVEEDEVSSAGRVPTPESGTGGRPRTGSGGIRVLKALVGGLLAAALTACSAEAPAAEPLDSASPTLQHAEPVETVRAVLGEVDASLIASGTVISPRTTLLSSEVVGRISEVRVDEGGTLRRGAIAFVVDPEPYRIDLEEARAGLQLAQAQKSQEEQELERTRRLAEQQIVAPQELDFRRTQLEVARARVAQARARMSRAESDLQRTVVRAPYDSVVVERHLHEGANLAGPSSVVLTLQALKGFEAQLAVPETSAVNAKIGDRVLLTIQGQHEPVDTLVHSVNPRIEPESRTYSVRAKIPGGLGTKAGAFVRAEITPLGNRTALVLPRAAILRRDGRSVVFRYRDGRAELTELQLGAIGLELAEVVAGLEVGDEIIVGAMIDRLADGSPVARSKLAVPDAIATPALNNQQNPEDVSP